LVALPSLALVPLVVVWFDLGKKSKAGRVDGRGGTFFVGSVWLNMGVNPSFFLPQLKSRFLLSASFFSIIPFLQQLLSFITINLAFIPFF